MDKLAVIGLGQMGATLATLLLQAKSKAKGEGGKGDEGSKGSKGGEGGEGLNRRAVQEVQVWNRTPARAESLAKAGAVHAATAAQACAAADIVVMCVHDHAATQAILSAPGVGAALDGKLLLQLSTASPQDAREMNELARGFGASFLAGAIQVAPEQMGQPDTTILISGDRAHYERARRVLAVFGGNIVYLGEDIAASAVMDLATLSYIYGASAGFIQGAAFAQVEGIDVGAYGAIVEAMSPSFGAFLRHEGEVIRTGEFAVSQSPLSISIEATRRIERIMRDKGLRTDLPALIARLLQDTQAAGHGDEEFAAVVKIMKPGVATPA